MKKKASTHFTTKSNTKSEGGLEVDLVIKFNPYVVFKVCSMCHEDMEQQSQRPFALFASNGVDPVCWKCGDEISREYADMLGNFYVDEKLWGELGDLREWERNRQRRLDTQKRDSLIKEFLSKGITEEQLKFVAKNYKWDQRVS